MTAIKKVIQMIYYAIRLLILGSLLLSQEAAFVGTNRCKACHSSEKKGAQYKIWKETKHAKAFDALLTEKARKIGIEKGLKSSPDKAPECLECHTVGFGAGGYEVMDEKFWSPADDDRAGKKAAKRMENLKNVGCENCHGPGSAYKKKKIMEAIDAGTASRDEYGLLKPNEESCKRCHNERSPSYKPFNFEERIAEITHPFPADMK